MNILVVEENQSVIPSLQSLLINNGYGVDPAGNGATALQMATSADYDLLLLDSYLPQLDAIRLCQTMRTQGIQTPILVLIEQQSQTQSQGNFRGRSYVNALNAGADDYMAKPYDADELVARVHALVQRKRMCCPYLTPLPGREPGYQKANNHEALEMGDPLLEHEREQSVYSDDELASLHTRCKFLSTANEALQQSEAKNRALLAAMPDLMIRVGADGRYREVVSSSCNFEVLSIDAMGKTMADVLPDDLAERADYYLQRAFQTGALQVYEQQVQVGDRLQYEEVRVIKSGDDEVLFIIRNITERKQAEAALQASEATFRHFAQNSHAVIWIANPTSLDNLYVNSSYERIWGRSRQSLIDRPDSWLDAIHPADRDQVEAKMNQQRQGEVSSLEYRIIQPDGAIRWIWDRGFAIRDESGNVYTYGGIAEDITNRKHAELSLQKQIRQEYLLADITQEIQRTLNFNDVLSSTVHRVREFLDTDRVIIFRFRPDWHGDVIMESVGPGWTPILSTSLFDPCFGDRYVESYRQGRISAVEDITQAGLQPCHLELLQQFQVTGL